MQVTWYTFSIIDRVQGQLVAKNASARYRIVNPAKELAKYGIESKVAIVPNNAIADAYLSELGGDVIVFSKSFNIENEKIAIEAKKRKIKVVFDICDDHFRTPEYGQHWLRMSEISDLIVTNTELMGNTVKKYTGKDAVTIGDPYEGPHGNAKFSPNRERLSLMWFGHQYNIKPLQDLLPSITKFSESKASELTIVTGPSDNIEKFINQFNQRHGTKLLLRYIPWSIEATFLTLNSADLVLIPSNEEDKNKAKSANRLVEALQAGRFTIGYPLSSHEEFRPYSFIDKDIALGISWAISNQEEVIKRVVAGQEYIESHYSVDIISSKWREIFYFLTN